MWIFTLISVFLVAVTIVVAARGGEEPMPATTVAPTHADFEGVSLVAVREGSPRPPQVEYATFAAG